MLGLLGKGKKLSLVVGSVGQSATPPRRDENPSSSPGPYSSEQNYDSIEEVDNEAVFTDMAKNIITSISTKNEKELATYLKRFFSILIDKQKGEENGPHNI